MLGDELCEVTLKGVETVSELLSMLFKFLKSDKSKYAHGEISLAKLNEQMQNKEITSVPFDDLTKNSKEFKTLRKDLKEAKIDFNVRFKDGNAIVTYYANNSEQISQIVEKYLKNKVTNIKDDINLNNVNAKDKVKNASEKSKKMNKKVDKATFKHKEMAR